MAAVTTATPREGVLLVTLDRPEARNAVNDALAAEMAEALDAFDADESLRVAVLTGAGGGFCAGLDLKAFLHGELGEHPDRGFAGLVRRPPAKPVIAAIEGFALAGGLEIALACDLIVAASDARIGIPEVARGLAADGGALLRLPSRVPLNVAMQMALTGENITVARLAQLGLVNEMAEPGSAVERALELAALIAGNAPLGVVGSKQVLREHGGWSESEAWERQAAILQPVWTSDDAQEGARAFAEKRPPQYRGR